MTHNIAILGASGYTGAELVRLIATHPGMRIAALSADRKAGMAMSDVFPHLRHLDLPELVKVEDIDFSSIDLCFCALPHGLSQAIVKDLPKSVKIVDLGADFRLRDPADYEKWYNRPHDAPEDHRPGSRSTWSTMPTIAASTGTNCTGVACEASRELTQ